MGSWQCPSCGFNHSCPCKKRQANNGTICCTICVGDYNTKQNSGTMSVNNEGQLNTGNNADLQPGKRSFRRKF